MTDLHADVWLAQRIASEANRECVELIARICGGTTDPDVRRDRLREAIVEFGLADRPLGKFNGARETFGQYFLRHYARRVHADEQDRDAPPNAPRLDYSRDRSELDP